MTKCVICSTRVEGYRSIPSRLAIPSRSPRERITIGNDWAEVRDLPRYSQGLPGALRSRFVGLIYASVSLKQQSGHGLGMAFLGGQIPSDLSGWAPDIVWIESQRRRRMAKFSPC
jgi:hypothetical protein